jgi:hypothetical protein
MVQVRSIIEAFNGVEPKPQGSGIEVDGRGLARKQQPNLGSRAADAKKHVGMKVEARILSSSQTG